VPAAARATRTHISHPPGGVRVSAIFALSRFVVARRIGQTSQLEHIRKTRQRFIRFGGDAKKVTALLGRCIFIFYGTTLSPPNPTFSRLTPVPSAPTQPPTSPRRVAASFIQPVQTRSTGHMKLANQPRSAGPSSLTSNDGRNKSEKSGHTS
jgi:hypothetical protein